MIRQIRYYLARLSLLITVFSLTACSTLSYYGQSIQGQFEVAQKSQSIDDLIKNKDIPDELKKKLRVVLELRNFSIKELYLPDNNSYLSYADLERDYVIWNIFANPEFSLEPKTWCYFFVGCLSYRGYFSKLEAEQHARELKSEGYDTYLGGVAAYSTLGWFNDPILNSMIRWNETYLATVMFHELAHQQLYIKNDTEFNEAYADAVAYIGVSKWLQQKGNKQQLHKFQKSEEKKKSFVDLITRYKSKLNTLYQSTNNAGTKRRMKQEMLENMRNEYMEISKTWDTNPYKNWFSGELNNAKLTSIITYRKYVPAFLEIYEKLNQDLTQFYVLVNSLIKCKPMKRNNILEKRRIVFEC